MNDKVKGLQQALDLTPDNHIVRLMLANELKDASYLKEALQHYGILLEKGQMLEQVLIPAGLLAIDLGEFEQAYQHLLIAQKLNVPNVKALEDKLESKRAKVFTTNKAEDTMTGLEVEPTIIFNDVGGLENVKKVIARLIILPFQRPELYEKYGKKAGGGVLLYGPPGCGKTMLARAVAGECKLPFYNIRIEKILDPYIGVSERNLHAAFEYARAKAPCVLFIDELDAIGFSRRKQTSSHSRALVDQLLQELDGIGSDNKGLLIMAATNAPWDIDDAMLRPGRFDRRIFVTPPDEVARRAILRLHVANRHAEKLDENKLAKTTPLFSGADLRALVEQATEQVIDEALMTGSEPPLTMKHLESILKTLQASTLEWLRRAKNYVEFANQDNRYDDVAAFLKTSEGKLVKG
ncbi:MAG: AAA family ATPase [Trueperaceae bacterium]